MWQLFCTDEDGGDPGSGSPWSMPGSVRMPLEHWRLIVEQIRQHDSAQANWLDEVAFLDGRSLSRAECEQLLESLEQWSAHIASGPALMPLEPTDEIPEPMLPAEHAQMLSDVARLLRHTMATGLPFDSWVD